MSLHDVTINLTAVNEVNTSYVCAFFQKDLSSSSSFFFHFYLQSICWSGAAHLPFQSQLFCSSECNDVSYFFQLLVATFSQDVSFTKLNWKRKCFLRWQHTVRKLANSSLVLKCPWVSLRVCRDSYLTVCERPNLWPASSYFCLPPLTRYQIESYLEGEKQCE